MSSWQEMTSQEQIKLAPLRYGMGNRDEERP